MNESDRIVLEKLQVILDRENPCQVQVIEGKATCRDGEPCCQGCPRLGAKGCTTLAPACKFYFCTTAWKSLSTETQEAIRQLGAQYKGTMYFRNGEMPMLSPAPYIW